MRFYQEHKILNTPKNFATIIKTFNAFLLYGSKNMKLKIIIHCLIFVSIIILLALFSSHLVPKTDKESAANIIWDINNIPSDTIDVLILGPSTSRYGYNSLVAWNRYGITTLNCSFGYLSGPIVKNMIIECLKRQSPKVILINIDAFLYQNKGFYKENSSTGFTNLSYNVFPELKWSINKLAILMKITKYYELNAKKFFYFLFPIFSTQKISFENILNRNKKLYLVPRYKKFFNKENILIDLNVNTLKQYFKNEIYTEEDLEDLFKFCRKLDIPVLFLGVPQPVILAEFYDIISNKHKVFFSTIKENGFKYINTISYRTLNILNLSYKDTYDGYHLNYWGSEKYTNFIAKILVNKYNLQDKRNNPKYYIWNDAAQEYIKYVKENFNIDISL